MIHNLLETQEWMPECVLIITRYLWVHMQIIPRPPYFSEKLVFTSIHPITWVLSFCLLVHTSTGVKVYMRGWIKVYCAKGGFPKIGLPQITQAIKPLLNIELPVLPTWELPCITGMTVFCGGNPHQTRWFRGIFNLGNFHMNLSGLEHDWFFPYIRNNHPNWLSYFSEVLKPPTSYSYRKAIYHYCRIGFYFKKELLFGGHHIVKSYKTIYTNIKKPLNTI